MAINKPVFAKILAFYALAVPIVFGMVIAWIADWDIWTPVWPEGRPLDDESDALGYFFSIVFSLIIFLSSLFPGIYLALLGSQKKPAYRHTYYRWAYVGALLFFAPLVLSFGVRGNVSNILLMVLIILLGLMFVHCVAWISLQLVKKWLSKTPFALQFSSTEVAA